MIVLECEILCLGFAYFATLTIAKDDASWLNSMLELQFIYRISYTVDFLKGVCETHCSSCPWFKLLNLSIAFASPSVSKYFIPISTINELNSVVIRNDRLFLHLYIDASTEPLSVTTSWIEGNDVVTILIKLEVVAFCRIPNNTFVAHLGNYLDLVVLLELLGQSI